MSALKLDPQEINAPKYLKKYYHGYTPELYKEIFDLWKSCRRVDIKRWTALDYAKRAQEKSLEELKEKEFDKYRDYTFIKVEDGWQKNFKSEEVFVNEFKKHINALVIHLKHNFVYSARDVIIEVRGYNPGSNRSKAELEKWNLNTLLNELERGTTYTYETLAKWTWKDLMKNDDMNIQKRMIEGWEIFSDHSGKRFYIDFLYDPALDATIKQEQERRTEEYMKNHPQPDAYGYHGGPGHYTGD